MEISNNASADAKELLDLSNQDYVQKIQLIRIDQVSAITTLAKSSINLWVAQSKFPKPITLSATVKVWKLQNVIDWIDAKHSTSLKTVTHRVHGDIS
jgi:prophage regulatory protein